MRQYYGAACLNRFLPEDVTGFCLSRPFCFRISKQFVWRDTFEKAPFDTGKTLKLAVGLQHDPAAASRAWSLLLLPGREGHARQLLQRRCFQQILLGRAGELRENALGFRDVEKPGKYLFLRADYYSRNRFLLACSGGSAEHKNQGPRGLPCDLLYPDGDYVRSDRNGLAMDL